MRKILLALTAVAAVGIAVPLAMPAHAEDTVVVKKPDHDRVMVHHPRKKVVLIERRHRNAVVINRHRDRDRVVVVKKRHRPDASVTIRER